MHGEKKMVNTGNFATNVVGHPLLGHNGKMQTFDR